MNHARSSLCGKLNLCFLVALVGTCHSLEQAAASEDAPLAASTTLRVLCYNIHYGQGNDGVYDLERLAKVIKDSQADIVALQEVDVVVRRSGLVHQARELAKLTGLAVRFGPTQHYDGGLYGNAVLTRFPVQDVHIQPLPYSESTAARTTYPRGAIRTELTISNGIPITFISTHFQHNVPEDRIAEAKAVNQLFAADSPSQPVILAGDMNATPDSEPIAILLEKWNHAMDAAQSPSAPSSKPRSRIDYVFYRGAGIRMTHSEVIEDDMASDHRPVLAVFEISSPQ
ncbi:MAG: endonuclease/exonuclease/phosphatase family protein [Planctomycetaceae bacterium]|nr:endonuclease/exonuclease/phosphatase family protein [Planctomycetaceae bacterium]